MQISESVCDLLRNAQNRLDGNPMHPRASKLGEGVVERAASHELGDEQETVGEGVGDDAEELRDAGVVKSCIAGGFTTELDGGGAGLSGWMVGEVADFDGDGGAGKCAAPDGAERAATKGMRGEMDLRGVHAGGREGCRWESHAVRGGGGGD